MLICCVDTGRLSMIMKERARTLLRLQDCLPASLVEISVMLIRDICYESEILLHSTLNFLYSIATKSLACDRIILDLSGHIVSKYGQAV